MKKLIIIIVVAAVAAGAALYLRGNKSKQAPKYTEAQAEVKDLSEYVEITGYIAPLNRVEIQPASGGRIEQIMVEEGARIKAGQVLALMSSSDRVAILDAARASSEEQYKQWQDTYKPIKVISPIDGTLILKNVVEGQTVSASTVLFAVSDKLIVEATVDESDIGKIKAGQSAVITLDAYPDKPVNGRVFQILDEGTTTNNVITYKVKIRPDSVPSFFKSQMTANLKVRISAGRKVLLVPADAIVIGPSGSTSVITSIAGGKPVYTDVNTGANEGNFVEVTSGLKDGAAVYTGGASYVTQKDSSTGTNPLMPRFNRKKATTTKGKKSSSSNNDAGGPPPM